MWAIVVAAGAGSRFGGPKQYDGARAGGGSSTGPRQVTLRACDGVVMVVPPDRIEHREPARPRRRRRGDPSASVRAGLAAVPDDAEIVVVHDARPTVRRHGCSTAVVAAVRAGADGAVPGVAVADTIKRSTPTARSWPRSTGRELVAVQTPQAFRAAALRRAHAGGAEATDDAALVEAAGGRVVVVAGEPPTARSRRPTTCGSPRSCLG